MLEDLHHRQFHESDVRPHLVVGLECDAHLIEVLPQNAHSLKLILADGKLDEADLAVLVPLIYDVVGCENAAQLAKAETRSRPHSLDLITREEAHEPDRVKSELKFYRHRPAPRPRLHRRGGKAVHMPYISKLERLRGYH